MLTLADNVRLGTFTVFRDVTYLRGVRELTSTFYALPDAPRVTREDDGGPAYRFWWYRRTLGTTDSGAAAVRAGGLLIVTTDLGPTPDERAQLKRDLAAKFQLDEKTIELGPIPFVSGTVELAFAGETGATADDFTNRIAGNGPAKLLGNEQATFAIDLTADGAALLADALDKQLDVLKVRYDLTYEYHLDGVQLRVWCDAHKAAGTAQLQAAAGSPIDAKALRAGLEASHLAGIEITSETPVPDDQRLALTTLGEQLLEAALKQVVIAPDGKSAKPFSDSAQVTLNHTFTSSFAAPGRAIADSLLTLAAADDPTREPRILKFDLAAQARPLDITIVCPVDFEASLVRAVHFYLAYDGVMADGSPLLRTGDWLFKPGTPTRATFHSLASPESRRYRWHADVVYAGGITATLPEVETDETLLVLAFDGLGVLDVEVALGDVPLDAVMNVVVELQYPPKQLTHTVILDGAHATDRWQAVAGVVELATLKWRPTFVLADRRVTGEWRTGPSSGGGGGGGRVIVSAPPDLVPPTTAVQLLAVGDFSGVAQILVELRTTTDPSITELRFTQAGQQQIWKPRLGPDAALAYQARLTVVATDGRTRAFDWTAQDSSVFFVRDVSLFTVQIITRLLDIGGAWTSAFLQIEAGDERETIPMRQRGADARFSFHVGSGGPHKYRYQLTLIPKGGNERRTLPWQDSEDEVLVLRPPVAS
jgi:hypothetical protein